MVDVFARISDQCLRSWEMIGARTRAAEWLIVLPHDHGNPLLDASTTHSGQALISTSQVSERQRPLLRFSAWACSKYPSRRNATISPGRQPIREAMRILRSREKRRPGVAGIRSPASNCRLTVRLQYEVDLLEVTSIA